MEQCDLCCGDIPHPDYAVEARDPDGASYIVCHGVPGRPSCFVSVLEGARPDFEEVA